MISVDFMKSSEVRKAADQPNSILESRLQENSLLRGMIIVSFVSILLSQYWIIGLVWPADISAAYNVRYSNLAIL